MTTLVNRIILGLLLAALFAGCSPSTGSVSGQVRLNGKRVDTGYVVVSLGDGNYRNTRFVPISNGQYHVADLLPGDYWVTISDVPALTPKRKKKNSDEESNESNPLPGWPVQTSVAAGRNTFDINVSTKPQ